MNKKTNDVFFSSSGLATFGPQSVRIIECLERCFLRWANEFKADVMLFPPLIRVEDLNKIDYFRNFPHLGVFTSRIQENLLNDEYVNGTNIQSIPNRHLTTSSYALPSAACYNVYLHFKNYVLDTPKYITTLAQCCRNEQYYQGLKRLPCFRLREIVCLGSEQEVKLYLDKIKQKVTNFTTAIGLPLIINVANDPFYDSQGSRAQWQKIFPVKEEFVYEDNLAVASVNFHRNFFGKRCNICTVDNKYVFSGCVGMGIERWIYALMKTFDEDVEVICDVLCTYLTTE